MPYPGRSKTVGGPIGAAGKTQKSPNKVFLPLSAFFLQMQGEMDGDGGEPDGMTGFRRKKPKKKKGKAAKTKDQGDGQKAVDRTVAGSGSGEDAIGGDSQSGSAGSAPKGSVRESYAKAMAKVNVGGDGSCPKCGSEPGCNIDCKKCMRVSRRKPVQTSAPKTEMTAAAGVGAVGAGGAGTTTGNVPTTPMPIGGMLVRVNPVGKIKKKKSKKKRVEWADRLMAMAKKSG